MPSSGPDPQATDKPPVAWRANKDCVEDPSKWAATRLDLSQGCDPINKDFITLSLSGGGTKAAVFAGETMFYLDAIGLLPHASMISSVSGGSFTSAYYSLSCDIRDEPCHSYRTSNQSQRPVWRYPDSMEQIGSGFLSPLVRGLGRLGFSPFGDDPAAASDFADYVDGNYLHAPDAPAGTGPFLFKDINPHRPLLVLNSTLISDTRPLVDSVRNKGYERRRTADEYFHFAFTDYYFRHIGSDLSSLPLSYGVTASGAFPVLVGSPLLANYLFCDNKYTDRIDRDACYTNKQTWLALSDGGANDNQGLIEVFTTLAELSNGEARSEFSAQHRCLAGQVAQAAECLRSGDRALLLIINSSITEATGLDSPLEPDDIPYPFQTLVHTLDRVSASIDVYSGSGYNIRKRLYQSDLETMVRRLHGEDEQLLPIPGKVRQDIAITPVEIGLVTLNDYPEGGSETAFVQQAILERKNLTPTTSDRREFQWANVDSNALSLLGVDRHGMAECGVQGKPDCQTYADRQSDAFSRMTGTVRKGLALNDLHPQCLFEQSKFAEASMLSLASMDPHNQACLRHAARWSTALRGQELCQQADPAIRTKYGYDKPLHDEKNLHCNGNHNLAALSQDDLKTFGTLTPDACRLSDDDKEQQAALRRNLRRNAYFAGEIQARWDAGQNDWMERRRALDTDIKRADPATVEDFMLTYPLDQVCSMKLFSPD